MTELIKFDAESKNKSGKGGSRSLRANGRLPAILYGEKEKPQMFSLSHNEFYKEYSKGGIKTKLVEINIDNKKLSVIAKDIQIDPVSDFPIHVDFLRVGKNTLINIAVTIRVINEDKSPGIKKGGIANIVNRKVLFHCHPSNIPHHLEVDLTDLEIGHNVHINDIKLPQGVHPVDKTNITLVTIIGRSADEEKATITTETITT